MTPVESADARATFTFDQLDRFCSNILLACGASQQTSEAAAAVMMHGTRYGVDSHGVRLLNHYVTALEGGRVNKAPNLRFVRSFGAIATLDADHAHGALAAYTAMDKAVELSGTFGIGAVAIQNSSHFGAAGAYALHAATQGRIGFATCNSDSFVRLHDGAMRFHGTNPVSVGVPVVGEEPWLLDMATSSIPYNRLMLYRSLGVTLPDGVASDAAGIDTSDPDKVEMLAPLAGEFGFKGAALAGVAEILSAVLSGMKLSFDIDPMPGPDFSKPRHMGAFVLAINPEAFIEKEVFEAGMLRYRTMLRESPAKVGGEVMAPGDREWKVAAERERTGVPIDPATLQAFEELAVKYGVSVPT